MFVQKKKIEKPAAVKTKSNKTLTLNDKPWISRIIRKSIKIGNKKYKQYFKEKYSAKKDLLHEQFKTYRKQVDALRRISREDHYNKCFQENKKGIKIIWSAIRTIVNVKPTNKYQPLRLIRETKTVLSLNKISNHFNKFFTQIANEIDKKNGKSGKKPQDYLRESRQNVVEVIIQNMQTDKACGPNSIPARILKTFKKELSKPLRDIINISLLIATFPETMKIAKITSVF